MELKGNLEERKRRAKEKSDKAKGRQDYVAAGERTSLEEKQRILDQIEKPELIELFQDWKPQIEKRRRKSTEPPLDQRVALSVTTNEKDKIQREIAMVRKSGDTSTVSQFIRNRATSSVDIEGWHQQAIKLLDTIDEAARDERKLKRRRITINAKLEELGEDPETDAEDTYRFEEELGQITEKLNSLKVDRKKRTARMSGRMTTPEAEVIKWRAGRLNLSVSDYLRITLFNHEPGGEGEAHLSVEAKKRFYIGIIEVAMNGWGEPPTINQCKQCSHYREEASKHKMRVRQLEQYLNVDSN